MSVITTDGDGDSVASEAVFSTSEVLEDLTGEASSGAAAIAVAVSN